jgi:hypothetical protein
MQVADEMHQRGTVDKGKPEKGVRKIACKARHHIFGFKRVVCNDIDDWLRHRLSTRIATGHKLRPPLQSRQLHLPQFQVRKEIGEGHLLGFYPEYDLAVSANTIEKKVELPHKMLCGCVDLRGQVFYLCL